MKTKNFIQSIYTLCLSLSLPLHVLNMGGEEGLKPFHITAVLSLVLSFFVVPRKGKLHKKLMLFLLLALLSSLISFSSTAIPGWLKIFIVIYSCYGLTYVNVAKLSKWLFVFIPVDLIILLVLAINEPQYRFTGYYNDPNYLCTTLLAFLFVSFMILIRTENRVVKGVQLFNIVVSYGLIIYTLSRTGLFCGLLLLLIVFGRSLFKSFSRTIIVVLILVVPLVYYSRLFIDEQWGLMYERIFEKNDNLQAASDERVELSLQNIKFIIDHPQYIFFGLGVGTTQETGAAQIPELSQYRKSGIRDHNTWTSCFSEHGIIAFILYIQLYVLTIRTLLRRKSSPLKNLAIGTFISMLLFTFSIYQTNYLPFWWLFFLINNPQIYNDENTTYSANRPSLRRNRNSIKEISSFTN